VQTPAVQPLAVSVHAKHASPPVPQSLVVVAVMQALPLQQPVLHPVLSQTHPALVQCRPGAHWAPPLQVHSPVVQPLDKTELQVAQVAPLAPQSLVVVPPLQVEPAQQPFGQDVLSQVQTPPPLHASPAPQGSPEPQAQVRLLEQALEVVVWQSVQAAPPVPHAVTAVPVWHCPFRQQPVAQFTALQPVQAPSWHVCGDTQDWHAAPWLPQL
jgi:hypothetical protein